MGDLEVRIRHGGGGRKPAVLVIAGAAVILSAGSAATVVSGLDDLLYWLAGITGLAVAASVGLLWAFRRRIFRPLAARHRVQGDIMAEKRAELAKIRAMRLQMEAARIAGVPITADMLAMAEDPELRALVQDFRAAFHHQDGWTTTLMPALAVYPGHETRAERTP